MLRSLSICAARDILEHRRDGSAKRGWLVQPSSAQPIFAILMSRFKADIQLAPGGLGSFCSPSVANLIVEMFIDRA
jgi:hypothetical protein